MTGTLGRVPSGASRLAEVLGGPALARLRARLRARLEHGEPLTGRVVLLAPSPEERTAIERLFGRLTRGEALHVDLDALAALLRAAGLGPDLATALLELEGPVADLRAQRRVSEASWRAVFEEARSRLGPGSRWLPWIDNLEATGLLRRLAAGAPTRGAALIRSAGAVLDRLPAPASPLAELAAAAVGDSHALDAGAAVGTVVLRALARLVGAQGPSDPEERRAMWASHGVLVDELSAPVLVLNLPASASGGTDRALALAWELGEPTRLSTRQLLRDPPAIAPALIPERTVFVCENPSIVAAAADRLGRRCRPLLCTEGQPKTALRMLIGQLKASGLRLAYHGDFDWAGIQIGNLMMSRFEARPWCFGTADYLAAADGAALTGNGVVPAWDPRLAEAMRTRGRAVHEEAVLAQLLGALGA
jgi:uncharacterized protein (TIGR02679 family)